MRELAAVVAGLVVVSFGAIALYALAAIGATIATLRRRRNDRRLSSDLDRVLDEVLGPPSLPPHRLHRT